MKFNIKSFVLYSRSKKRKSSLDDKPTKRKKKTYEDSEDEELGDPDRLAEDEEFALRIMSLKNQYS